jgi:hypothetical protein
LRSSVKAQRLKTNGRKTRDVRINIFLREGKFKAIPLQAWTGPEGSRRLRLPYFMTTHEGGKVVSLKNRPPLPPQEIFLVLISIRR